MEEYRIIYLDMPCTVKGLTVQDETGFYNVYINAHLNIEQQQDAIKHELRHIERGDFYSLMPLEVVEYMK